MDFPNITKTKLEILTNNVISVNQLEPIYWLDLKGQSQFTFVYLIEEWIEFACRWGNRSKTKRNMWNKCVNRVSGCIFERLGTIFDPFSLYAEVIHDLICQTYLAS